MLIWYELQNCNKNYSISSSYSDLGMLYPRNSSINSSIFDENIFWKINVLIFMPLPSCTSKIFFSPSIYKKWPQITFISYFVCLHWLNKYKVIERSFLILLTQQCGGCVQACWTSSQAKDSKDQYREKQLTKTWNIFNLTQNKSKQNLRLEKIVFNCP